MKTTTRNAHSPGVGGTYVHTHNRTPSLTTRANRPTKVSTPLVSPRPAPPATQITAPKLSPARVPEARAPSPNYFEITVDSPASSGPARDNRSPSSSIKSFGAALPKHIPADANPEFEAFRRQIDLNKGGTSFGLSTYHNVLASASPAPVRPRPSRWNTHASDASMASRPLSRMDIDQESIHDSAYVSSDSKRNSESSLFPLKMTNGSSHHDNSATDVTPHVTKERPGVDNIRQAPTGFHMRMPPPPSSQTTPQRRVAQKQEATSTNAGDPSMISADELQDILQTQDIDRILLLDIRSSQSYAQSRIQGALNLCIPTTLLKRPAFNIEKLQQTFSSGSNSAKFSRWSEMHYIIVYDSHSSDKKDCVTAENMIKKFTSQGFFGKAHILRGGFSMVQNTHKSLIDNGPAEVAQPQAGGQSPSGGLAPVIGGVMLPTAKKDSGAFFSNIRQNMDLADGVGQFDVSRPEGIQSPLLPNWIRDAAAPPDHGKQVSDKFLQIEMDEKNRMQEAYAAFDPRHPTSASAVQLSGVEKGGKNRYKDILPFEHARVKLVSKQDSACDYVNASHIQASRSNKRYIATQGPLPATFEDFWTVIWEQDVRVIVMLTAETEGGQLKCHPYWKGRDFGDIRLKLLSEKKASLDMDKHRSNSTAAPSMGAEQGRRRATTLASVETPSPSQPPSQTTGSSDAPFVIVRKFALTHTAHPFAPMREITHLHFPAWPDFGTPAKPSHLLALVELANIMQRAAMPVETASIVSTRGVAADATFSPSWHEEPEQDEHARPMLVHCSAGCGRTGTFCTVDSVIDMLRRQRKASKDASHRTDSQGDIEMSGYDEPISPLTTRGPWRSFDRQFSDTSDYRHRQSPNGVNSSWIQDETIDLIQQTVTDFRQQRLSMVQSLRQYVLCYETVLEWMSRMHERSTTGPGRARAGSFQQRR